MKPPYLVKGDKIALVAPARKIPEQELLPAISILVEWGFEPVIGQNLYGQFHQFSGTDEERAADFQQALDDPEVKAILAVRGGYGCLRIIDRLNFDQFKKHPKWIIGYSDITVFHSLVNKTTNVPSIHATMPVNFLKNAEATHSLLHAISGSPLKYEFSSSFNVREKSVEGELIGGNLSLLFAMLESPTSIQTENKILFLEDLDEYLYHIDRMMLALKRAGKLANLKALIIGGFTDMKDNEIPFGKSAEEIILETTAEYNYPVYFNFPAGHQALNKAIRLGMSAKLEPTKSGIVFHQES